MKFIKEVTILAAISLKVLNAQRSECQNNKEYEITSTPLTFDDNIAECVAAGGTLAQVKNIEEARFVASISVDHGLVMLIGLSRLEATDGAPDPKNFQFLDGSFLTEGFGGITGVEPWFTGEPNSEVERCVELANTFGGLWNDVPCEGLRFGLCEFPCDFPTPSPTQSPTKNPTKFPSSSPTQSPTSRRSECFNRREYEVFTDLETFDTSVALCREQGGILAQIKDTEAANFVGNISLSFNAQFFIGLQRSEEFDANFEDPKNFQFLDGSFLTEEFGGDRGLFPWLANEPNGPTERCVEAVPRILDGLWNDVSCDESRFRLCEFPCEIPTTSPTQNPTKFPSLSPTENPTKFPSLSPTENPTKFPSSSPTQSPTSRRSECFNRREYEVSTDLENFDTSVALCREEGGILAQVNDTENANFVKNISLAFNAQFFIGLQRSEEFDGNADDPKKFQFLDGSFLTGEFGGDRGLFPWFAGEPNGPTERCVEVPSVFDGLWNDVSCDELRVRLCEFPCEIPTTSPTQNPTQEAENEDDENSAVFLAGALGASCLVCLLVVVLVVVLHKKTSPDKQQPNEKEEVAPKDDI